MTDTTPDNEVLDQPAVGVATRRMKTMDELRADIAASMDLVQSGQMTASIANAQVNQVAAYLRTYKLQMDYAKQTGKTPNIPILLGDGPEPA